MVKKPFKYTHVGRLPEDWDCLQAIEVIDEISMGPFGSDITVSNFVSSGVPVLNGYNVSQIMLIDKFQNFVTPKKAKELKKAVAHRGDIIVTHRGTIGQVSYIPDSSAYSEYVISQSQFRVHFNDKRVNSHFLVSYLLSPIGQKYLLETKGHTGVPALAQPTTNFRRLWIPLPEIAEQVAIAEALSNVDSLISSLQKLIEKKKAIKQGAMQELLTGQKRFLGFSGEWETRKVGELCSIVTKQTGFDYTSTIKPNLIEHPQSNALPMIQTKNFVGRKFNFSTDYYIPTDIAKEFDKIVLDTVCLLFSIVGASVGNIGLFPGDKVAFCGGAIGIAKFYHEIDAIYAFYYFLSESGQQQIRNVTKGGAQATVTIEDIREFTIPYPNLKERALIAQTLSDMDSEIEQQEKKLAKYQQIKQGMMQELLTGRIRLV